MNEKQRRFAEFYAANPNAAEAAKAAGYSEKTARSQGQRLLTNVDIQSYIRQLQEQLASGRISTMTQVKAYWSDTMNDHSEKTADRLRASELFAKAAGAFIHYRAKGSDDGSIITGEHDGEDVVIYMPEIDKPENLMPEPEESEDKKKP